MTRRSLKSLRAQLLLLILLGVVPTTILVVWSSVEQRWQQGANVRADLLGVARVAAGEHARQIAAAHTLLSVLSHDPTLLRGRDCAVLLDSLARESNGYANVGLFRPDGSLVCSGRPTTSAPAFRGDRWFTAALASRDLVIAAYAVHSLMKMPLLRLAHPIIVDGEVRGLAVAALDFNWAERLPGEIHLPPAGTVRVVMQRGAIAAAYTGAGTAAPGETVAAGLLRELESAESGTVELPDTDGARTLYAFQALAPAVDGRAWIVVGVPAPEAYASADARLWRNLWALVVIGVVSLVAAQAALHRYTLRPLHGLLRATTRIAAGDLAARTGVAEQRGEVGELAAAFDRMASSLETQQHELRASADRVRTLVEQSMVGVYVMRRAAILYVNDACGEIFRCPSSDLVGKSPLDLLHPDDMPLAVARLNEDAAQPAPGASDLFRIRRADGSVGVVEVYGRPIEYEGRRAILGTMLDVTERETAAQARKSAHDELVRLRLAVEASGEIVFITDRDGIIRFVNPAFTRVYGYTAEDVVGRMTPRILKSGLVGDATYEAFWRTILRGDVVRGDLPNRSKDGRIVTVETSANPIRDGSGEIVGFLSIQRDVTDQQAAREERDRLASVVEQMAEATIVFDPEQRFVYVNPAWERLTGYSAAEVLGQHLRLLQSGEHDTEFFRAMFDRLDAGGTWSGHITNRRKDGSLFTEETTVTPIRDGDGRLLYFVAVSQDVAERRSLELQLRQSQKMEAIGRLAGGIAHDFNNLLTVILGQGEMLEGHITGDSGARRHAEAIRAAAERASRLTRQLLAFGRRQQMSVRALDLRELIDSVAGLLRRLIGEDITLRVVHGAMLGGVCADPVQIEQVLMNLAVNARDAMPDGGTVTIETTNVVLDRDYADRHVGVTVGHYVQITVTDTGDGMSEETRSRIFEPFFTTKGPGKGTGLGLSTTFGIVKQHGGNIWVYSEPGRGTTFKVYLPRTDAAPAAEAMRAVEVPAHGSETILLVEDDDGVRGLLADTIAQYGYRVLAAAGGEAAEAHVREFAGRIHLMLTDIVMPGLSGPALFERVAPARPDMRVLFMSGYTDLTVLQANLIDEQSSFIAKPFTHADLARKIRSVLDGRPV